jgi:hypothetical protein
MEWNGREGKGREGIIPTISISTSLITWIGSSGFGALSNRRLADSFELPDACAGA